MSSRLPTPSIQCQRLLGQYRDRCGTRYDIAVRVPYGFGLYYCDPAAPNYDEPSTPHQTDPAELQRQIDWGTFNRLDP